MESSEIRKYLEAQAWVDESWQAALKAKAAFEANQNDDTRWDLAKAYEAWRRDLDTRMNRADVMSDEDYRIVMRMRQEAKAR